MGKECGARLALKAIHRCGSWRLLGDLLPAGSTLAPAHDMHCKSSALTMAQTPVSAGQHAQTHAKRVRL